MEIHWRELADASAPGRDEVQVYAASLDQPSDLYGELLSTLSCEERQHAARFQLDKPRRQFVVGRAVLRRLLATQLQKTPSTIALQCDSYGKPHLEDSEGAAMVRFNLAHSADLVLVAMTIGCDVGVDVERLRAVNHLEHIAQRYFHPEEVKEILSLSRAGRSAAFLRCWTGKEAVVKALGGGLHELLSSFRVPATNHSGTWIDIPAPAAGISRQCWLRRVELDAEYVGALACVGEHRGVRCLKVRL